jgi:hypothetical protein
MDALAFCIVACLVIAGIALFVKIFNKGKSLPHARAEECNGGLPDVLTQPWYDDVPGNLYYDDLRKHNGDII